MFAFWLGLVKFYKAVFAVFVLVSWFLRLARLPLYMLPPPDWLPFAWTYTVCAAVIALSYEPELSVLALRRAAPRESHKPSDSIAMRPVCPFPAELRPLFGLSSKPAGRILQKRVLPYRAFYCGT